MSKEKVKKVKNKVIERFLSTREVRMVRKVISNIRYTGIKSVYFDVEGRAIERFEAIVVKPFTICAHDTWSLRYFDDPGLIGMKVTHLEKGDSVQVRPPCVS